MSIGIGIYVKDSVKAVNLYIKAFNMRLGYHVFNEDGTLFHSELYKDDEELLSVVEGKEEIITNPIHLGYIFNSKNELIKAFNLLKEDGKVLMDVCSLPWCPFCCEVQDRFGVIWFLSLPQHVPDDDELNEFMKKNK